MLGKHPAYFLVLPLDKLKPFHIQAVTIIITTIIFIIIMIILISPTGGLGGAVHVYAAWRRGVERILTFCACVVEIEVRKVSTSGSFSPFQGGGSEWRGGESFLADKRRR